MIRYTGLVVFTQEEDVAEFLALRMPGASLPQPTLEQRHITRTYDVQEIYAVVTVTHPECVTPAFPPIQIVVLPKNQYTLNDVRYLVRPPDR